MNDSLTYLYKVGGIKLLIQEFSKLNPPYFLSELKTIKKYLDPVHYDMLYRILNMNKGNYAYNSKNPTTFPFAYSIGNEESNCIMIIGEVVGKEQKWLGDPTVKCFSDPSKKSSSYYLHNSLALTSEPNTYYITNIRKTQSFEFDKEAIEQELYQLRPRGVITLGNSADELYRKMTFRMPTRKIPHPSWARRFNTISVNEYSKLLEI